MAGSTTELPHPHKDPSPQLRDEKGEGSKTPRRRARGIRAALDLLRHLCGLCPYPWVACSLGRLLCFTGTYRLRETLDTSPHNVYC